MKKRLIIAVALLVLLTTINTKQEIIISKFNIKEIRIDNNFILKEKELKKTLSQIYDKNLIFLSNNEIEKSLKKNNLY